MSLLQRVTLPRTYVHSTTCLILGAIFNTRKSKQISYRHTGIMQEVASEKGRSNVMWQASNGIRFQVAPKRNLENTWKATDSIRFSDGRPTQCVTIPLEYRTSQNDSVSTNSRQGFVENSPSKSTITLRQGSGKIVPTLMYTHSIMLTSCWR